MFLTCGGALVALATVGITLAALAVSALIARPTLSSSMLA